MSKRTCSIDGCQMTPIARGWCSRHYYRWRQHGDPNTYLRHRDPFMPDTRPEVLCSVDGCDSTARTRGWCNAHYARWRTHGTVKADVPINRRRQTKACSVNGCERTDMAGRDLCQMHYRRWLKYGDPGEAAHRKAPGGAGVLVHGYRIVSIKGQKLREHRVIMEQALGRPLRDYEEVHHINGIRDDNRPANLELWVKSQPAGQRASDLADWVVDTYPELVEAALAERRQLRIV